MPKCIDKIKIPPIKIQGIKTKLIPFILGNSKWDGKGIYYEPFMGSGIVGFNIKPEYAIFSDTNPHIINFYKSIQNKEITSLLVREFLEEEGKKLSKTPADKNSYYYEIRERFNKYHDPLDFLFLQRSNFNGMIRFNKKGEYNTPFGRKPNRFSKSLITKITNQVKWVENLILNHPQWEFRIESFEESFRMANKKDFIYLDPPYINKNSTYYNIWTEEDAKRLSDLIYATKSNISLSMWYKNNFRYNPYINNFDNKKFKIITTEHFYHLGGKKINRNSVEEALIIKKGEM